MLVETARRLTACLRKVDVVSRFGGDEFVVLLPDVHGLEDAGRVAGKIAAALRQPMTVLGREVAISSSVGVALYPEHGADLDAVLKASDAALYAVKHAGRDDIRTA